MWHFDKPFAVAASVIYSTSLAGWAVLTISFPFSFLGWDFSLKWLVRAGVALMIFIVLPQQAHTADGRALSWTLKLPTRQRAHPVKGHFWSHM